MDAIPAARYARLTLDLALDALEDMRFRGDRRLLALISTLFGQLPDILEDVWVDVALGQVERVKRTIDTVPRQHPFKLRYHRVESVNWESCATVLNSQDRRAFLARGWN